MSRPEHPPLIRATSIPEGPVADFRVVVTAGEADEGFRMFTVRLTGTFTGITAEEVSPVPEWALIRCWRKLVQELKARVQRGEAPESLAVALRAADATRPESV